jgi:hypothetical protein
MRDRVISRSRQFGARIQWPPLHSELLGDLSSLAALADFGKRAKVTYLAPVAGSPVEGGRGRRTTRAGLGSATLTRPHVLDPLRRGIPPAIAQGQECVVTATLFYYLSP